MKIACMRQRSPFARFKIDLRRKYHPFRLEFRPHLELTKVSVNGH